MNDPVANAGVRIAALRRFGPPGLTSEAGLGDIARLAAMVCRAPYGLVQLVDGDSVWHRSRAGPQAFDLQVDSPLCAHALDQPGGFTVGDLAADPRFGLLPIVTDCGLRFFHSHPLIAGDVAIGLVCALATAPRKFTADRAAGMAVLAAQAVTMLDLGRRARGHRHDAAGLRGDRELARLAVAVEQSPASIVVTDAAGLIEHVNAAFTRVTGYTLAEVRGQNPRILKSGRTPPETYADLWDTISHGRPWNGDLVNRKKNGDLFWEHAVVSPVFDRSGQIAGYVSVNEDISEAGQARVERDAVIELLRIANADIGASMRDFVREVTAFLKEWSGCEAVGLRLRRGDDYRYYETTGFPLEFVVAETSPCARDEAGRPILRCTCGDVLCGRYDPSKPYFTEGGSFWTNGASELLALTTDGDGLARTCKRCNREGHESVALVPIRFGGEALGLLHFGDRQAGRFTQRRIDTLERLANNLGVALAARIAHEQVAEREARYRSLVHSYPGGAVLLFDSNLRVLVADGAALREAGWELGSASGHTLADSLEPHTIAVVEEYCRAALRGEVVTGEYVHGGRAYILTGAPVRANPDGVVEGLLVAHEITKRKRAEDALRASEERLRAIASNTPDHIFIQGRDLRYTAVVNPPLGLAADDMLGRTDGDLLTAEEAQHLTAIKTRVIETGEPCRLEVALRNTRGGIDHFAGSYMPSRDALGAVDGLIGYFSDITERKHAEEALRESEERYRLLFDACPDGVVLTGTDGLIQSANRAACTMYGYGSAEELVGTSPTLLIAPSMRAQATHTMWRRLGGEDIPPIEYRLVRKDGTEFWGEVSATVLRDVRGAVTGYIGLTHDTTERRAIEEEVARSEREFRTLAESLPDVVARYDSDLRVLYVSPQIAQMAGIPPARFVGKTNAEVQVRSPERLADWERMLRSTFRTGEPGGVQAEVDTPGGTRTFESRSVPEFGPEGDVHTVLTISRDVTDRLLAERQVEEARAFLQACIDSLSAHICVVDDGGLILAANRAWREFAGANGGDESVLCEGANYFAACDAATAEGADDATAFAAGARGVLSGSLPSFAMNYTCDAPDEPRWFSAMVTRFPGDGPPRAVIAHESITDLSLAEEALRDSEERFRLTFDQAPVGAAIVSLDGRFLRVNDTLTAMLGYTADEMAEMTVSSITYAEDIDSTLERIRQLNSAQVERVEIDKRYIHKHGHAVWTRVSARVLRDQHGNPLFLIPTMQDITDRKRAEMELAARNEELSELSRRLVEVQEDERKRLASELHDEIGQILTGIKLALENRAHRPGSEPAPDEAAALEQVLGLMGRVRELSMDLRPPMLDDMGLVPAVQWQIDRYTVQTGVRVDLKTAGVERRFGSAIETAAYRIVQEALTNVARYARIQDAAVVLWADDGELLVQIEDQGVGFDDTRRTAAERFGISGMQERAGLLGGSVSVDTSPGSGTTVTARIPLDKRSLEPRKGTSP